MQRGLAALLRLLLVAAFVPVLVIGFEAPTLSVVTIFAGVVLVAVIALRLGASPRWRALAVALAGVACAAVWSLALAATRG